MAVQISGNDITVPRDGSFTRNVTIGGTLTYEDVTNIDSVGLITARTGIEIGARPGVAASISVDGNMIVSGVTTLGGEVQIPDYIHHIGDNNCKFGFESGDTFAIETAGSERVRVTSDGKFLIGTSTPQGNANADDLVVSASGHSGITIRSGTSSNGNIFFADGTSGGDEYRGVIDYNHSNNHMSFSTNASERARVTSDGNLGIGTITPSGLLHTHTASGTNRNYIEASASNAFLRIKSGSTSNNSGVEFFSGSSNIANVTGVGAGGLQFEVGGSERLRIQSTGVVNIGDSTASSLPDRLLQIGKTDRSATYLELRSSTSSAAGIVWSDGTSNDDSGYRGTVEYNHSSDYMYFKTAASERYRMHNDGSHSWNNTTFPYSEMFHFYNGSDKSHMSIYQNSSGDYTALIMRHGRGGLSGYSGKAISFRGNDGTEEGSIVIGTTNTAYNTSSDYRLKENEVLISDGITRLKQLKPYRFNFKKDPSVTVDGFFAHEVTPVVPQAVSGSKDEVYTEENATDGFNAGDMKVQSLDYSKLTPLLTAALQEAIAEIESLKQRLDAAGL